MRSSAIAFLMVLFSCAALEPTLLVRSGSDVSARVQPVLVGIRVQDDAEESYRYGTGMYFAEESANVYLLTAGHVVRTYGTGSDAPSRVQVRFAGTKEWVDASRSIVDLGPDLDAALVKVGLHDTPFATQPIAADLEKSPDSAFEPNKLVRVLGLESTDSISKMEVRRGKIIDCDGANLAYESEGLRPGMSGAPLLSESNRLLGIHCAASSVERRFVGVSMDAIIERASSKGIPSDITFDPLNRALRHCARTELPIGICTAENKRQNAHNWVSISQLKPDGSAYSGIASCAESSGPCNLAVEGSVLRITYPPKMKRRFAACQEFRIDETESREGFIICSGAEDIYRAQMAIPKADRALAACFLVGDPMQESWFRPSSEVAKALQIKGGDDRFRCDGREILFPLELPDSVDSGKRRGLPLEIRLPASLTARGVTFEGTLCVTDAYNPTRDRKNRLGSASMVVRRQNQDWKSFRLSKSRARQAVSYASLPETTVLQMGFSSDPPAGSVYLDFAVLRFGPAEG